MVTAVDASTWGLGARTSVFSDEEVQTLGRYSERWRFESENFSNPRVTAFGVGLSEVSDETQALQWAAADGQRNNAEQVPPLDFGQGRKDDSFFQPVGFLQLIGIGVFEARATLFALKHALRKQSNLHTRHLILSAICAIDRGRGKTRGLRRVTTQQLGSLLLGSGCSLALRWIASEFNPADGPSRGSLFPSKPSRIAHGDPPPDFAGWAREVSQKEEKETNEKAPTSRTNRQGCVSAVAKR